MRATPCRSVRRARPQSETRACRTRRFVSPLTIVISSRVRRCLTDGCGAGAGARVVVAAGGAGVGGGEATAEAGVDVGQGVLAAGLAKALEVGRADGGRGSGDGPPDSISSASLIVIPLIDSPPLDSIIVRGIAFRQRESRSQKTSIENSSPRQAACTIDSTVV